MQIDLPIDATTRFVGSRRRRLWELDPRLHCPVLGVCLSISMLRRLVDKVAGSHAEVDDYALHCAAVADCTTRSPVAENMQRELDRRYAPAIRKAARCKTTVSLAAWLTDVLRTEEVAGPLWATLTHCCCTPELAKQIEGFVHMLQHQAGMAARVDLNRLSRLVEENAVLARDIAALRQRSTRLASEHARRTELQQADIVRSRAELMKQEAIITALKKDLKALETAIPGLRSRADLVLECHFLIRQRNELQSLLSQSRRQTQCHQRRAEQPDSDMAQRGCEQPRSTSAAEANRVVEITCVTGRAVLCVGGRVSSVPIYRQLIESAGARFLHHDGGKENSSARLDCTLAAADLVICQTGCISHDAYWRVKDHCKRSGKKCVYTDLPSATALKRVLAALTSTDQCDSGTEADDDFS